MQNRCISLFSTQHVPSMICTSTRSRLLGVESDSCDSHVTWMFSILTSLLVGDDYCSALKVGQVKLGQP